MRFKEMTKHLWSASWLLISSISAQGVVSTEIASVELTFPGILYNHDIVDDLSFKKTLSSSSSNKSKISNDPL